MRKLLLGLLFSLGFAGAVLAQSAPPQVQAAAQHLDACNAAAVSTNFNTINNQAVATITPPAGQFVYFCRIELSAANDGTGTAGTNVNFTSTGLGTGATASPQWPLSTAATAEAVVYRDVNFGLPFKSQTAGAQVTITSPSAEAHTGFGIVAYYYFSP